MTLPFWTGDWRMLTPALSSGQPVGSINMYFARVEPSSRPCIRNTDLMNERSAGEDLADPGSCFNAADVDEQRFSYPLRSRRTRITA